MIDRFRLPIALLFIMISVFAIRVSAQDNVVVKGRVLDSYMHEPLETATVRIYHLPDSAVLGVCKADIWEGQPDGSEKTYTGEFNVRIPRGGRCIIEISDFGYQTLWKEIDLDSIGKRQILIDIGTLQMKPEGRQLDEVVVKASLIKIYNKGDTLVYNADAFKLAEGSMLDALIEQLPGVELRDDGAIFVQGRYVEALMMNGKEFLGNNNQLLLSNLPSYTVKNVQVYDKLGRASELAGADLGDSQYAMDVKLKKEYMVGMNVNAEAGLGSDNRYLGRLFGMSFTPNNQYMAYVNVNNLNDSRKPGQDGSWSPDKMPSGILRTAMGGFDYSIKTRNSLWEITGNASASHTRENDGTERYVENYLVNGRTYGYSFSRELNRMLNLSTSHRAYWKPGSRYAMQLSPNVSYQNWDRVAGDVSATFNKDYNDVTSAFIEGIYSGSSNDVLKTVLNRAISQTRTRGHSLSSGLGLWQGINLRSGDVISININGSYANSHQQRIRGYDIRVGGVSDDGESRLQRFNDYPDYRRNLGAGLDYRFVIRPGISALFGYGYTGGYVKETSMLHYLEGQSEVEDFMSGQLPSAMNGAVLDASNSFVSRESSGLHKFKFEFNFSVPRWWICVRLPIVLAHRHLTYERGDIHTAFSTNRMLFDTSMGNSWIQWRKDNHNVQLSWTLQSIEPSMVNMVDYVDTTDPLYLISGNPDLKNALKVDTKLSYSYNNSQRSEYFGVSFIYGLLHNGIALGSDYDTTTGVRKSKYMNVNGNRNAAAQVNYRRQIRKLQIENGVKLAHVTSVDFMGQDASGLSLSKVFDNSLSESLRLTYSFSRVKLGMNFAGSFNRFTSNRNDFSNQNTWNFNTGLNGVISLPANFSLSADLTMYNRRGFSDQALNTDNFVLNYKTPPLDVISRPAA